MKKACVVLAAFVLVACGAPPVAVVPTPTLTPPPTVTPAPTSTPEPTPLPCYLAAEEYHTELDKLMAEWDDKDELAEQAPRMSLTPLISDLQDLKREIDALEHPACTDKVAGYLSVYMSTRLDAYTAFLGKESDTSVATKLHEAEDWRAVWLAEYAKLVGGIAPYDQ